MCGFPTTKMGFVSPLHSHEQRNTSCYSNTPHATFSMANFPRVSKDSRRDFNSHFCQWSNPSWEGGYLTIPGIPYENYWENCKSQPTNLIQNLPLAAISYNLYMIQKKTPKKMSQAILQISHHHKSESSNEALTKAEASKGVGLFSRKEWSSDRLKVSRTFSILESLSLKASRLSMILYCFFLLDFFGRCQMSQTVRERNKDRKGVDFRGSQFWETNVCHFCYLTYSVTGIAWNSGGFHFLFGRELSGLSIGFPRPKKCCEIATSKLMPRRQKDVPVFFYFCIYMHYVLDVALGKRHDIATIHVIKIVNSPGSISLLVSLSLGSQWLRKILTWKQKDMQHAR